MLRIICCVCVLCVAGCSGDIADELDTRLSADRPIDAAHPAVVALDLEAGHYLVQAREHDIDLELIVDAPGTHSVVTDVVPRHGLLVKVVSLTAPGALRVMANSKDHRTKQGIVTILIGKWRRAENASPTERELGYAAYGLAGEQTNAGTQESWSRAAASLNEAAAHFDTAGDPAARADAEYTLGHLQYLERDDRLAAVRAAESASEGWHSSGNETGVSRAATLRAASELEIANGMDASAQRAEQRSMFDAADRRLVDSLKYFQAHNLEVDAEYAVNMRGVRAIYEGDLEESATLFSQAVELARKNHDTGEQFKSLANLAWVHNRLGYITQAAHEFEQLLPLTDRERQPAVYAAILASYGYSLIALGDFDRALELHTEALQMYVAQGQELEQERQLAALGGLYFRTGDLQRALDTLRAAIEVQERIKDLDGMSSSLRVAGNAAAELEQHSLALQYLRRAAQIDVNPNTVASTRVLVAGELRVLGDLHGADNELARALTSTNVLARAEALAERGRLRMTQKNLPAAIEDLREADKQFATLALDFSRIDTNAVLSQALLAAHDVAGATTAADRAIEIVSRIRLKSANPEWRAQFLSARYLPYEARIAAELASGGDSEASAWRALRIAEDVRARSLNDLLADEPRRSARAVDPAEEALRAKLTAQQLALETKTQSADASDADLLERRRAVIETRARLDALRLRSEGVAAHDQSLPASLGSVEARIPPDVSVLSYFVGDTNSHAWLLSHHGLRHAVLPGRTDIGRVIDALIDSQRPPVAKPATSADNARKIFANLLDGVTGRRLMIIPDGPLNGLPFAAVTIPGSKNDEELIDRFVVGYSPSLALAFNASHAALPRHRQVAVVSDPVYASDDRRLAMNGSGGNFRGPLPASPNRFTRLPYSALEASSVLNAFGARDTIQLSGFEANTERVLRLPFKDLGVLHFATHASARSDSPEQSALFLSQYTADGRLLSDSTLSVGDITRGGLRADVVVLSGCETGAGGRLRGEGVLGLAYGFLANGSHSVMATLWPVEDASTARFMNEFYEAYRRGGRATDALRSAQLHFRALGKSSVWTAFVVRANEFP